MNKEEFMKKRQEYKDEIKTLIDDNMGQIEYNINSNLRRLSRSTHNKFYLGGLYDHCCQIITRENKRSHEHHDLYNAVKLAINNTLNDLGFAVKSDGVGVNEEFYIRLGED